MSGQTSIQFNFRSITRSKMEKAIPFIRSNQEIEFRVGDRDVYIHLPSFVLGALVIGLVGPILKTVIGGIWVGLILFSKFAVVIGIALTIIWILSGSQKRQVKRSKPTYTETINKIRPQEDSEADIGSYKYFNIPVEKEPYIKRKPSISTISIDEKDLYTNFVRKARR